MICALHMYEGSGNVSGYYLDCILSYVDLTYIYLIGKEIISRTN